jgi:hypothetical protein
MTPHDPRFEKAGDGVTSCHNAIYFDFRYYFIISGIGIQTNWGTIGDIKKPAEF